MHYVNVVGGCWGNQHVSLRDSCDSDKSETSDEYLGFRTRQPHRQPRPGRPNEQAEAHRP